MTSALACEATNRRSQVRTAVADVLRVSPHLVTDDATFASLGIDSLTAAELTAAIEDVAGVTLSLSAVHEHPTVAALVRYLDGGAGSDATERERMRADAQLPHDIMPRFDGGRAPALTRHARRILLTGSTGFLGAYILRTLLDETDAVVVCLAREGQGLAARDRVMANLQRYGLLSPRAIQPHDVPDATRVIAIKGDLAAPLLGLPDAATFDELSRHVDAIVHCGARVDWASSYGTLHDANVRGTQEVLRLACLGEPKPVHFVSSVSVCYSLDGPRALREGEDSLPYLEGLRLGYAQSKCVAESLVMEAGRRGLPVTVIRPALVAGDSVTGVSNVDDLLTRFIRACVEMKCAPDLDWRVDCLPVDQVARAVVRLALDHTAGIAMPHISAEQPRHWRECVLWMRLCGYDLELLPYAEWLSRLEAEARVGHPLHPLRSFFLTAIRGGDGLTLPEAYEESRRTQVVDDQSRSRLMTLGASCNTIGTETLDRYFARYVADGVLPDTPTRARRRSVTASSTPCMQGVLPELEQRIQRQQRDESLRIHRVILTPLGGDDSIISELTSWSEGAAVGLFRGTVHSEGARGTTTTRVVVKVKPAAERVIEVAECIASLANTELGQEFTRCRDLHGLTRGDVRELALYRETDPRIRAHAPALLAGSRAPDTGRVTLVLEEVPSTALLNSSGGHEGWTPMNLGAAIDGAAAIHSVWYGRETELVAQAWLAPPRTAANLADLQSFWRVSAEHALTTSPAWRNAFLVRVHRRLVDSLPDWGDALTRLPRTLIHNDFNPRNFAIRRDAGLRLSAFDWELAALGLPQRDLAELLCWALPGNASRDDVSAWLERSRVQLIRATGSHIAAGDWGIGFRAALCELLVDRLAMYAMIDRFRPQPYLQRIVRNWTMLHRHFPW